MRCTHHVQHVVYDLGLYTTSIQPGCTQHVIRHIYIIRTTRLYTTSVGLHDVVYGQCIHVVLYIMYERRQVRTSFVVQMSYDVELRIQRPNNVCTTVLYLRGIGVVRKQQLYINTTCVVHIVYNVVHQYNVVVRTLYQKRFAS